MNSSRTQRKFNQKPQSPYLFFFKRSLPSCLCLATELSMSCSGGMPIFCWFIQILMRVQQSSCGSMYKSNGLAPDSKRWGLPGHSHVQCCHRTTFISLLLPMLSVPWTCFLFCSHKDVCTTFTLLSFREVSLRQLRC